MTAERNLGFFLFTFERKKMKSAITFLLKAIVYKNEALVVLSGGTSVGLTYYIDKILIDTEIKYIILPVVVSIVGFAFFFFLFYWILEQQ